jgi:hypothetical protein
MQIKRAADQTLIAFACHVELLRAVDIARVESGDDRSSFIRKAVFAELKERRQPVEEAWINPPDRAKKARYPAIPPAHLAKAGKSAVLAAAPVAAPAGRKPKGPAPKAAAKYAPKRTVASPSGKTSAPAPRGRKR